MGRSAAFFDLDKTIIARSSTLAFSRPLFAEGLLSRRAVLRSAYAQLVFAASGADHGQMEAMRSYLTKMVTGWDVNTVRQVVAETLHDTIGPLVYAEAVDLIESHRAAGRDVVIVSASGREVVEPIGAMLGVDRVIATELAIEDDRYTGEILSYAYGPGKAELILDLAASLGYDLSESYAYSDSETDIPMLEVVGHPFAVNPDKVLRQRAEAEGWPVRTFARPVALESRLHLSSPVGKALAGVSVAAGVALAGLAVSSLVRRRLRAT